MGGPGGAGYVAVVNDDPQELRYVRDTLVNTGYRPVVTWDPEEAIQLVQEEAPKQILLDLVLPETDGIELMRNIQRVADLPVIFLSAYGQDHTTARAFDMGGQWTTWSGHSRPRNFRPESGRRNARGTWQSLWSPACGAVWSSTTPCAG